jgi:hypothetical protein
METWSYKGHLVTQRNRQKNGRWLSSAKFRTKQGEVDLTAYPANFEGYDNEILAKEATARFVRDQIDKSRAVNVQPFGFN